MKTSIIFSLAYLGGVGLGLVGGHLLPWWASGVVGWSAIVGGFLARWMTHRDFIREWQTFNPSASMDAKARALVSNFKARRESAAVVLGVSFGAFAGAAAVDASEVLDALVWPGHEVDGSVLALLVALAWLLGVVVSDEDNATFRPWLCGLGLYLFTVVLTVFPAVWEVL